MDEIARSKAAAADVVRQVMEAFNARTLDAFLALLTDDVEIRNPLGNGCMAWTARASSRGGGTMSGREGWTMKTSLAIHVLVLAAAGLLAAPSANADDVVVVSSIQAAVEAAQPGDTVVVPPGRYRETVTIAKNAITIRGSHGAVLDASGFSVGIRAAAGPGGPGCPSATLTDITIDGLRIENASFTGVLLRGVDGFAVRDGVYTGNEEYAIFPICSRHGTIDGNDVRGTDDAAIYVGNSHDVVVEGNHATDSTAGIEIENSTGVVVRGNTAIGNTSGIVTFVLPGLAVPVTEDVLVERNVIMHNNRPNPVLPSEDAVGLIPTGSGILTVGADRVTVRENRVVGNDSGGIAVVALPFANPDPRVDPFPDGNEVRANIALANGTSPDPLRSRYPGADLVYDGSGSGTCFVDNIYGTSFPTALELLFGCG